MEAGDVLRRNILPPRKFHQFASPWEYVGSAGEVMKKILLVMVLGQALLVSSCTRKVASAPVVSAKAAASGSLVSPKTGKTYSFVIVPDTDGAKEKFEIPPGLTAAGGDDFQGTARKAAKTSVSNGPAQAFADLAALFGGGLFLPDSQMIHHRPLIAKTATSDRVTEEQHNVVVMAFLYASSKEADNDFHCVIGTAEGQSQQFLNVEVSGLPVNGSSRTQLEAVRNQFKTFFGANLPGQSYHKFDPPIPVRVSGSIFFDIDHKAGEVGPVGLKPKTAWEIHPVTDMEFEPGDAPKTEAPAVDLQLTGR
jgi:hypothetical protein